MKIFNYIIAVLLLTTACHKDDKDDNTGTTGRRTIIAYMAGENNLSQFVQNDVWEMITASRTMPEDCTLLIFVDGSSKYEKPFIARLNGRNENPVDTLYKFQEDFYTSDADRFQEVLSRAIALCPSQEYGLILWGHANGWIIEKEHESYSGKRAYGLDNGQNTAQLTTQYWMNIPSMAQALKDLGVKWKFIFSDCCNMQCVEVAYELRDVAEYLIASPAEITGEGAPYDQVILDLCKTDDKQMYQSTCDDYNAQNDYASGHLPISVVQTEKIYTLLKATRAILPLVNQYIQQENAMDNKIYYYSYNKSNSADRIMYDMNEIVMSALEGQDSLYSIWKNALNQTVVYKKTSNFWHTNCVNIGDFASGDIPFAERQGVISMFFPLSRYEKTSHKYNNDISQMAWYHAVGWSTLGW